jgi:hypothetical protein
MLIRFVSKLILVEVNFCELREELLFNLNNKPTQQLMKIYSKLSRFTWILVGLRRQLHLRSTFCSL